MWPIQGGAKSGTLSDPFAAQRVPLFCATLYVLVFKVRWSSNWRNSSNDDVCALNSVFSVGTIQLGRLSGWLAVTINMSCICPQLSCLQRWLSNAIWKFICLARCTSISTNIRRLFASSLYTSCLSRLATAQNCAKYQICHNYCIHFRITEDAGGPRFRKSRMFVLGSRDRGL